MKRAREWSDLRERKRIRWDIYHSCLLSGWWVIMSVHISGKSDESREGRPLFCLRHFGIWKRQKNSYSLSNPNDWAPEDTDSWPQEYHCTPSLCSAFFSKWFMILLVLLKKMCVHPHPFTVFTCQVIFFLYFTIKATVLDILHGTLSNHNLPTQYWTG